MKLKENQLISVQMRLLPRTMKAILRLSNLTHNTNKSQVVSIAIRLTEEIAENIHNGAKVYIEKPNGILKLVKIFGLN